MVLLIINNASLIIKLSMMVYFSITIFIALFIYGFVTILLNCRVFGFRLELAVVNTEAAQYARLNPNAKQLIIMKISGAIAGIAGYTYFVANLNKLGTLSSTMLQEFDIYWFLYPLWAFNSRISFLLLSVLVGLIHSQTQFFSLTSFDYEIIDIIFFFLYYYFFFNKVILFYENKSRRVAFSFLRYCFTSSKQYLRKLNATRTHKVLLGG